MSISTVVVSGTAASLNKMGSEEGSSEFVDVSLVLSDAEVDSSSDEEESSSDDEDDEEESSSLLVCFFFECLEDVMVAFLLFVLMMWTRARLGADFAPQGYCTLYRTAPR